MPSAGSRTKRYVLGCGLVVATVAVVAWLSWPRERLLLEMARPVCRIDTSKDGQGDPKEKVYWITSNRALIISTGHEGNNGINGTGTTDWKGHAELFDTRTHTRTRMAGLTNLLNRPGLFHGSHPDHFQLSPMGSLLYWRAEREHQQGNDWVPVYGSVLSTLDGREVREWEDKHEDEGIDPYFWMDEQHLVKLAFFSFRSDLLSCLTIRDIHNSRGDHFLAPSSEEARSILTSYRQKHPLMTNVPEDEARAYINLKWFDARTGQIENRDDDIVWPENTHVAGSWQWCDLPSRQITVTVLVQSSETPFFMTWIHRIIPSMSLKPTITEGLWVSRAGSQQVGEIGHIPVRLGKNSIIEGDQLQQVEMLPDGKQIGFVFKGMLYLVPVKTLD